MNPFWEEDLAHQMPTVIIGDIEVTKGSRVRLCPQTGGDIMDLALAGKIAVVEGIEQDLEDNIHIAVTVEDDPGRDLGEARQPGHRFFFSPWEVEPLSAPSEREP